jgi:hypothetical protein
VRIVDNEEKTRLGRNRIEQIDERVLNFGANDLGTDCVRRDALKLRVGEAKPLYVREGGG